MESAPAVKPKPAPPPPATQKASPIRPASTTSSTAILLGAIGLALLIAGGVVALLRFTEEPEWDRVEKTIETMKNVAKATEEARENALRYEQEAEIAEAKAGAWTKSRENEAIKKRQEEKAGQTSIAERKEESAAFEKLLRSNLHPWASWPLAGALGFGGLILLGLSSICGSLARQERRPRPA